MGLSIWEGPKAEKLVEAVGDIAAIGRPTPEQAKEAIDEWLEEHPEATTTVEDGSITYDKLNGEVSGDISVLKDKAATIGNTPMGTTATTITAAIAEHEREIESLGEDIGSETARATAAEETKISKPTTSPNGLNGQLLRTNGDGTTIWVDQGLPTDEQTAEAIDAWLDEHPEATTTVEDGAVTYAKLSSALQDSIDDVSDLKSALSDITTEVGGMTAATSGDIGKALMPKTVADGKVTSWEFGSVSSESNILYPIPDSGETPAHYVDIDTGVAWEAGTLVRGEPSANNKWIRSSDYISFDQTIDKIHIDYGSDDIEVAIYWYDENKSYVSTSGDISSIVPYDFNNPVAVDKVYWKFIMRYKSTTGKNPDETLPTLLKIQYYDPGQPGTHTDRTSEIESILSEYGECILSKGDFYVSGIEMPIGSKLSGQGMSSHLILMTVSSDTGAITPLGDNTIADLSIESEGGHSAIPSSATLGHDYGIICPNNVYQIRISNCDIKGFTAAGIYGYGSSSNDTMSALLNNCRFIYNTIGIWFYGGMEFNSVANCVCNRNYYGVRNEGGNNLFTNCHIDSNTYGFAQLAQGVTPGNFGHGSVVGCTFNHNTSYGVYIHAGGNGMAFTACQMWYAPIYIRSVTGISFGNCEFGGVSVPITFYGSAALGNRFINNSFSVAPTVSLTSSATSSAYIVKDCYLFDGTPVTFD